MGNGSPAYGIVTALPKELAAIISYLNDVESFTVDNDSTVYTRGTLRGLDCEHEVVVACLSKYANNVAAATTANMLRSFPTVRDIVLVGIAAGVPRPDNKDAHVRLGNVVVSSGQGVLQFDLGAQKDGKFEVRGLSPSPSARLLQAVNTLETNRALKSFDWDDYLSRSLLERGVRRPSKEPKKDFAHPRGSGHNVVHYGRIGASNSLMRDKEKRDFLADQFGIMAFEMEGSGVADATWEAGVGYLIIRGVSDYGDSHKEDTWQSYAAQVAAAFCSAVFLHLPSAYGSTKVHGGSLGCDKARCSERNDHGSVFSVSANALTSCLALGDDIVVSGFDGLVHVVEADMSRERVAVKVSSSIVRCLLSSGSCSQNLLAGTDAGEIVLVNLRSGKSELAGMASGSVYCIMTKSGSTFISGDKSGTVSEWEIYDEGDGQKVRKLRDLARLSNAVFSLSLTADRSSLLIFGAGGMIAKYDFVNGECREVKEGSATFFSGYSVGHRQVAVSSSEGSILILDEGTLEVVRRYRCSGAPIRKVISSRRWLFSAGKDYTLRAWSLDNGETRVLFEGNRYLYDLSLDPDGKGLYFVDADGQLRSVLFEKCVDTIESVDKLVKEEK